MCKIIILPALSACNIWSETATKKKLGVLRTKYLANATKQQKDGTKCMLHIRPLYYHEPIKEDEMCRTWACFGR